jgi:tRNA G10  N-methylase Trm11
MPNRKNKNVTELFSNYIINKLTNNSSSECLHTDLRPVTYKGIYSMHKYWGKKPHNIDTRSATDLSNLPDESVDYIFTDPPHGDRIPYIELRLIWMAWLQMKADFEAEIVISNAKNRNKDIKDYQMRLELACKEMHRVLKNKRLISIVFNSRNAKAWDALITSCVEIGFEIFDIKYIQYSANSVLQDSREGGLRGDFVITFRK